MSKLKIQEVVAQEMDDFKNNPIEIVDGYEFSQYETVRRINLYLHDKYLERNDDAIFWNLSNPRIVHVAKNIDLDTKDLLPYGQGETNFYQTWILKMKLQKWMRDYQLSITLNDIVDAVASFGSGVVRLYKVDKGKEIKMRDLRNLYFNQAAECIRDENVVEVMYMTEAELRKKKDVWDGVEDIIEKAKDDDGNNPLDYEIWERWGDHVNEKGDMVYQHHIGWGYGEDAIICVEEEVERKDCPYYDFHVGKYRGRWLRIGIVERLFKLQESCNKFVNQDDKASEIASLLLLRTQASENKGNVLEGAVSGDVIDDPTLEQVGITNREFGQFVNKLRMFESQADRLCLTPEVMTGEPLPSGTPFRSLAVLTNAAKSAFKDSRDRIGAQLEEILMTEILPAVVKGWNKGEIFEIAESDEDIILYDQWAVEKALLNALKNANLKGELVTPQQQARVVEKTINNLNRKGRTIEIPEKFWNFDYGIRFNITGESMDKSQQNDAMFNALQMIQSNPMLANIPLFKQYLENNGIQWWRLSPQQMQDVMQGQRQDKPDPVAKEDKLLSMVDTNE